MPIKVTCPKCQGVLHAPDDAGGKRGKCPTCGTVLAIPANAPRAEEAQPFGNFGGGSAPAAAQGNEHNRSSFGLAPEPDARRESSGKMSPPPPFGGDPRRSSNDPFAKPGKPPAAVGPTGVTDAEIRGWRKTRRGLWWVRLAYFLLLLGVLAPIGVAIAEHYGTKLPSQNPGYLQLQGVASETEIRVAAWLVPMALGLLLLMVGRLGVSNAPRTSYSKGLLGTASIATLFGVGALVAFAVPTGGQVAAGIVPRGWGDFIMKEDINGMMQRFGLVLAVILLPLAEVWFVGGLGRVGASLHSDRLAGRASRLSIYAGLIVLLLGVGSMAGREYSSEVDRFWAEKVRPQWDKVGEHQFTVINGAVGLAAVIVWLWYTRIVGAARLAIREWLERHDPNG